MARQLSIVVFASSVLLPLVGKAQTQVPIDSNGTTTVPVPVSTAKPSTALRPVGVPDDRWLIDPRVRPQIGEQDLVRFGIHGEYQVRYGSVPKVRLDNYGFEDYRNKLGQTHRLEHYLRFSPRFTYRRSVTVLAQFDLPKGMFLGQSTDHVQRDKEPLNERQPMQFIPRYLYVDFALPTGHLTVGQQPASWGTGLVDDSGDNRQFLGDPRLGTLVDRVAFTGRPLGKSNPWELLVATDFVFSDGSISAQDGDHAIRAVIGNSYVWDTNNRISLMVVAQKLRPHFDDQAVARISPQETTVTFDLAGQIRKKVPGMNAQLFACAETAYVVGKTDLSEVLKPNDASVQRVTGLLRVGVIQTSTKKNETSGPLGIALEWGYASGDANPGDGTDHRATTNPGRRVGLVLFDEVLRWKTARAATALDNPHLGQRQTGANFTLPSNGGVSGATYLAAQFLYRPTFSFDIRTAAMIAQSTTDFVDPAQVLIRGNYSNFDAGNATHRDLGLELDAALEYRLPLENGLYTSFGAEAAVLFPGEALTDDNGTTLGQQSLVRGRFGFYF